MSQIWDWRCWYTSGLGDLSLVNSSDHNYTTRQIPHQHNGQPLQTDKTGTHSLNNIQMMEDQGRERYRTYYYRTDRSIQNKPYINTRKESHMLMTSIRLSTIRCTPCAWLRYWEEKWYWLAIEQYEEWKREERRGQGKGREGKRREEKGREEKRRKER